MYLCRFMSRKCFIARFCHEVLFAGLRFHFQDMPVDQLLLWWYLPRMPASIMGFVFGGGEPVVLTVLVRVSWPFVLFFWSHHCGPSVLSPFDVSLVCVSLLFLRRG